MSEIKVNSIKGVAASSAAITINNTDGTCTANLTNNLSNRNAIVNGGCLVAQRGISSASADFASVDRMKLSVTNMDQLAWLQKQSDDAPDGFQKSWEFDVTTAESALDADDLVYMRYAVEAQDLTPFFNANGTGKDFILSFYVKAYQTGTYQISIFQLSNSSRFITKTYTIAQSGVWQRIELAFTGDTNQSGFSADNTLGFQIAFQLIAGSNYTSGGQVPNWGGFGNSHFAAGQAVNVGSSTDNYWKITGIQLELDQGSGKATDFEFKTFAQELASCQRYCQVLGGNQSQELLMHGTYNQAGTVTGFYEAPVQFRGRPTFSISNVSHVNCYGFNGTDSGSPTSMSLIGAMTDKHWVYIDSSLGSNTGTGGLTVMVRANSTTSCKFTLDAEL